MAIYKINDKDSDMSIEFEPRGDGLIQVIMSEPENNLSGGCITITKADFDDIVRAMKFNKPTNQSGKFTQIYNDITELLQHFNFTVNGGVIPDEDAYNSFAVQMIFLIEAILKAHKR